MFVLVKEEKMFAHQRMLLKDLLTKGQRFDLPQDS